MELFHIIQKPVLTQKSYAGEPSGIYTVFVHPAATKVDIKQAFTRLYGVGVEQVNITKVREKFHSTKKGVRIKRKERVKAIVRLHEGERIADFSKLAKAKA